MFDAVKTNYIKLAESKFSGIINETPPQTTFATVAKRSSIILRPKNSGQPTSATKADILRAVDPVEANIKVTSVSTARSGSLVIGCSNVGDSTKLKSLVDDRLGDKYEAKQVANLNPRIRLVGISEKLDEDVLVNYLKFQNNDIFNVNTCLKIVSVTPLRKNKNLYQAMLQVDVLTYNKILNNGYLIAGYDYCSVYDGIDLRRCYKCCGFHHLSKQCSKVSSVCPRCSEGHPLKDCKSKNLKCFNCLNAAESTEINNLNVNHAVWDPDCKVYKDALSKFRSHILGKQ